MSWPCYSLINPEISHIKCLNSKHLFIGQVTFSILISYLVLKTSAGTVSDCESVFLYSIFQDGFLLQPFEKDDRGAQDQAEKEDGCDKVEKLEKTPRKMLSRGEARKANATCGFVRGSSHSHTA